MSATDAIRKFERLLMSCDKNAPVNVDESKSIHLGTYTYDLEKGTETYTPANKVEELPVKDKKEKT